MSTDKSLNKAKNKSICFVIPHWATGKGTGGAELQCYYLSEELIAKGWNVEVLIKDKGEKNKVFNKNFYNPSVKVHRYKRTSSQILNLLYIFFKLIGTKSHYYYNRTDARLLRGTCGLYCKLFSKKMIFAVANNSDIENKSLSRKYKNKKVKSIKNSLKRLDAIVADRLIRRYVFASDFNISQTNFQQEQLKEKLKINSTVIRNSFKNPIQDNVEKENIILWISNIRPQKQPALVGKLIEKLDLKDWKVVMIGNYIGYENIINSIKHPNFKAVGSLPFLEVLSWLNRSKVLLNTSSSEGFPNSFIHAWFLNVTVVSLSFDPDMLIKNKQIGHCAYGDFNNFVQLVQNQINGEDNSEYINNNALTFAHEQFDLDKNVNKFLSAINN